MKILAALSLFIVLWLALIMQQTDNRDAAAYGYVSCMQEVKEDLAYGGYIDRKKLVRCRKAKEFYLDTVKEHSKAVPRVAIPPIPVRKTATLDRTLKGDKI